DVVFLVPGQPVMRKADFAVAARDQSGQGPRNSTAEARFGRSGFSGSGPLCGRKLTVVVTPTGGAQSMTRAGHTLSILEKQSGKWVLARDANMLAPVRDK
ncbi:MAG: hypothetical protein ABIO50_02750, partial [Nitrosospira sp.]